MFKQQDEQIFAPKLFRYLRKCSRNGRRRPRSVSSSVAEAGKAWLQTDKVYMRTRKARNRAELLLILYRSRIGEVSIKGAHKASFTTAISQTIRDNSAHTLMPFQINCSSIVRKRPQSASRRAGEVSATDRQSGCILQLSYNANEASRAFCPTLNSFRSNSEAAAEGREQELLRRRGKFLAPE
jgi:hypothetical protein